MVSAIPEPAAIIGSTSARYGVCVPAATSPIRPAPPSSSPVAREPRAISRPETAEATVSSAASGNRARPVRSAE